VSLNLQIPWNTTTKYKTYFINGLAAKDSAGQSLIRYLNVVVFY